MKKLCHELNLHLFHNGSGNSSENSIQPNYNADNNRKTFVSLVFVTYWGQCDERTVGCESFSEAEVFWHYTCFFRPSSYILSLLKLVRWLVDSVRAGLALSYTKYFEFCQISWLSQTE